MRAPLLYAASDLTAIVVFVTVGLLAHDRGLSAAGYARDALPLAAGWFAAAAVFHAYSRPSRGALVATWAVGITAGVLARALVLGHRLDGGEAAFLLVCLAVIGLLVVALRGALVLARGLRVTP
jgi:hypothetical protein